MIKKQIRVLGIDDSPFEKFKDREVLVIATLFRGGDFLDGVLSCKVKVDGSNSTNKLINMINSSKFKPQLQAILLDGIAFGGFNIIDIKRLYEKTNIPVIVVMRDYPDIEKIVKTLRKLKMDKKITLIKKAGDICQYKKIFFQFIGTSKEIIKQILKITCTRSNIPEPIRVAHLIGAGIVYGESKGKA